jgi:hypothetical protein
MSTQTPRILQQPEQDGSAEQPRAQEEMGEGSYEGTREYNKRTADYLKTHDVEKDAEAAKPRSEEEAREIERAEEEGKSHSKGEK